MNREVDELGRIIATQADYAAIRDLVADSIAQAADLRVGQGVRGVVKGVKKLAPLHPSGVSQTLLRKALRLDKANVSRHVAAAIEDGYLHNLERRRGYQARLVLGEPLLRDRKALPTVAQLFQTPATPPSRADQ
jgi:hypothetical protein